MKESGINYFYNQLGLSTGSFAVYYTFETGVGLVIPSISGGQAQYSGILDSSANFWIKPGSGFFSGNSITINNASGLNSTSWTDIFIYEKINTDDCVIFNSLNNGSGYKIGITKSNKPYFESYNQEPIIASSLNTYSSKNVASFTYLPNYLIIGYYNFNSKAVEFETFDYPFEIVPSDNRQLGTQYTGWMDSYIHLTEPISTEVQAQLFSGLWAIPTGTQPDITQICTTGITGYENIFVATTGVTGYVTLPGGDIGRDYYTGQFPTYLTESVLTGYLSTGLMASGLTGITCYPVTGDSVTLFEYLTGYASSFGMEKIELTNYVSSTDLIKLSYSNTPFDANYNLTLQRQYSGYYIPVTYTTGQINAYLNGLGIAHSGWIITGNYIIVSGASDSDIFIFDFATGGQKMIPTVPGTSGYSINYVGQEIYLNGLNLVSGYDFIVTGGLINLTNTNTGIVGYIFEYPIFLASQTGNFSLTGNILFQRNTSLVYVNGLRQQNGVDYVEGSKIDLLSGNNFNPTVCQIVYDNTDLYWE